MVRYIYSSINPDNRITGVTNKRFRIILILFIFCLNNLYSTTKKSRVLILPFKNKGNIEIDYLNELIQNSLFAFFNIASNYSAVSTEVLKQYFDKNQYKEGDLQNRKTLFKIARDLNTKNIIRGDYHEKEGFLVIDFEVIDVLQKKIIYRSSKFGKGSIHTLTTIDTIAVSMVQDFTGIQLHYAFINIITDNKCQYIIDDELTGEAPAKIKVSTGKHKVKVIYKDEKCHGVIKEQKVNLEKDDAIDINIRVFVELKIDSEKECNIYINDKKIGTSPYKSKLLSGNKYELKVTYTKQNKSEELVNEQGISTIKEKDISLYFNVTKKVNIFSGNNPFTGGIIGKAIGILPQTYEGVDIGEYKIKAFLDDNEWKRKLTFYNKKHYITPPGHLNIDLSVIKYEKKWQLGFIPSALQFYNRQPIKGSIIISTFMTSVTLAALSPLFAFIYYKYDYINKINYFNSYGEKSNLTSDDIDISFKNIDNIFMGFMIGGLITALSIYIYSIIDGAVNMNHIYNLFHPQKRIKKSRLIFKIKPAFVITW